MKWSTKDLVVLSLGVALAVFFAGVTAAVAAGQTPPTAMWAAGSAVSGGLLGLLAPSPGSKQRHMQAANEAETRAKAATAELESHVTEAEAAAGPEKAGHEAVAEAAKDAAAKASSEATEHRAAAAESVPTGMAAIALAIVFALTLVLSVALAAGWLTPSQQFVNSLNELTKAVIALASASGTALVGLFAPQPSKT